MIFFFSCLSSSSLLGFFIHRNEDTSINSINSFFIVSIKKGWWIRKLKNEMMICLNIVFLLIFINIYKIYFILSFVYYFSGKRYFPKVV